jgi:hypothetical protein
VGTSTTDALSALVEYLLGYEDGGADPSDVAALFEALEHDLVGIYDTPAGADELRRRMQQDGFVPSAGGTRWDVVLRRPGDASGNTSSPDEPRTAPEGVQLLADLDAQDPTLGLVTKLTALNDAQRDLHRAEAALRSSRYDLYALWWKTERRRAGTVVDDAAPTSDERQRLRNEAVREFQRLRDEAATDVRTATTRRGNAADDADAARVDLEPLLGSDAARTALAKVLHGEEASTGDLAEWLELVDAPAARFYAPADPVVVISGGRSSPKHGGDGRFSDDGTLLVRFGGAGDDAPGQTLRFGDTAAGIDSSTFVDEILPGLLPNDDLPAITRDLLTEFVLLDGSAMPALASARGDLWRDPTDELHSVAAVTADAGFTGVRPSPVGVERWRQPWRPLHLCWRATWYPTEYPGDWSFDGDDLRWIGTGSFDHAKAMTLQGRSLLATAPTGALQDALDAIYERIVEAPADPDESEADRIAEHAELRAKLDQARQRLADADLLAQALTGFHDQLVQRDATQYYDPPDEPPGEGINSLLGDLGRAAPMPYDDGPDGAPRFFPIRGGHARLRRLWIVDAFGQVFDVFHERGQTDASFVPLRGRGLRTVGLTQRSDTQMLQFPPRLVQPSRLDFRFDTSGSGAVRGWLLPNHLDASLQLYDHDGNSLGSLIAWHGNLVRWQPEPGRLDPAASISAEVTRIKDRLDGKPVADLSGFLDAIDRTLRTTDPLGQRGDNLSVLVGRPVAVVAATFAVELDGPALTDQSWGAASTPDDGGVSDLSIQLRLGLPTSRDDGTLGWFESGDSRFHSVLTTPTLVQNDYVVGAGAGSGPTVPVGTVEQPADPLALTMLVDPRGSINAATGFLPHKSLRLPRGFVDAALARMDATFRVGPILSGRQVRMPLPADISSGWSWIDKTGVNLAIDERDGQWNVAEVESAAIAAHLTSAPTRIREGWLRLAQIVDDDSNDTNDTTADNGGQP